MRSIAFVTGICLSLMICGCLKKSISELDKTNTKPADTVVYTTSKNTVTTPVTGSWQWILTNASEGGISTPASTHSTMRIEFETDSTVKEFNGKTLSLHENYTYVKNYTFFDNSVSDAIEMNYSYFRPDVHNDTLRLDLVAMADPSYSLFVKAR